MDHPMPAQYTPGSLPFLPFLHCELICEQCAVRFLVPKKKASQRFCSRACKGLAQRTRVARPCRQCGAPVPVDSIRTNAPQRGKYCSPACSDAGRRKPLADRFWSKVRKADVCWRWSGQTDSDGYGRLRVSKRPVRRLLAHRVSWTLAFGPIPDGLYVLHRCDTPPCVRPDHLFLGTDADNHRDAVSKGRQARGERSGSAKLTAEHVQAIRARYAAGDGTMASLAREYGVGSPSISNIVTGKTWEHLE